MLPTQQTAIYGARLKDGTKVALLVPRTHYNEETIEYSRTHGIKLIGKIKKGISLVLETGINQQIAPIIWLTAITPNNNPIQDWERNEKDELT